MQMNPKASKCSAKWMKYVLVISAITILALYMLYNPQHYTELSIMKDTFPIVHLEKAVSKYLVYSSKCRIPNLSVFSEDVKPFYRKLKYVSCSKLPLLTYTTVNANKAILHINQSVVTQYSKDGVSCCYSSVSRTKSKVYPDKKICVSVCKEFIDNVTLSQDIVVVTCNETNGKQVYKNVHTAMTKPKTVEQKLSISHTGKHLSVLLIGIDSVSRLNLMRGMPQTYSFLKNNQWLEFQGYNKVADNTFPNVMAFLTGMNKSIALQKCKPTKLRGLDNCKITWYDYRKLGYVTAFSEDTTDYDTFNFKKKGFFNPPTDYYFRPYMMAAESKLKTVSKDKLYYCTGPEVCGERMLRLVTDFATTFKQHPYFGLFWMNCFSHNYLNSIQRMDQKVQEYLQNLQQSELLNNTVVVFLSDHGIRFGEFRRTYSGRLEERLPFFFMYIPEWFKVTYAEKYNNLVANQNRLTTPYDFYMTLQEILVISGKNYTVVPSSACPNCRSFFEKMESDRSCEDASIEAHWCTCARYKPISTDNSTVQAASNYIVDDISKIIKSYGKTSANCANYKVKSVKSSNILETGTQFLNSNTYLRISLQTVPNAFFEATVSVKVKDKMLSFKTEGDISRMDYYNPHSYCVSDATLRKYCYCI